MNFQTWQLFSGSPGMTSLNLIAVLIFFRAQAAVWLKLAECKQTIGLLSEAVSAYYKVLELAPDQVGVTLELSNLCRRLGRTQEAVRILAGKPPSSSSIGTGPCTRLAVALCILRYKHEIWYKYTI